MKEYKRQYREQSPETKQKISASLKGKQKSDIHKQNISTGLKSYWEKVPPKTQDSNFTNTGRIV